MPNVVSGASAWFSWIRAFTRVQFNIGSAMNWITDVEGIKVGHFTDSRRPTGCTVVLYEPSASIPPPASCDGWKNAVLVTRRRDVAVNSVGDVIDRKTGEIVAGGNIMQAWRSGVEVTRAPRAGESTTIGVIATNAAFDKTQMTKIAQMAHDGVARAVNPAHTPFDGDTLFAMSTGTSPAKIHHGIIGALAAEVVSEAIIRAVTAVR